MSFKHATFLLFVLAAAPGTVAAPSHTMSLYLSANGQLYEGRHVPISRRTLILDLTNGTPNGPYDYVIVKAAPNTAYGKVVALQKMLERYGPPRMKMKLVTATHK